MATLPRIFIVTVTVLGGNEYTSEWSTYGEAWEAGLGKAQEIVASEALDRSRVDWGMKIYVCEIPTERTQINNQWEESKANPGEWGGI